MNLPQHIWLENGKGESNRIVKKCPWFHTETSSRSPVDMGTLLHEGRRFFCFQRDGDFTRNGNRPSMWTFTIQLQFTKYIYKLDLKVRMSLQDTPNQLTVAGKLLSRSTTCIWNSVATICEKKLLLRIDWNRTVISALHLCFYHALQLESVRHCAAEQVPLWHRPYYKLKFCFKEQMFIVLSSQATMKIQKHRPCARATDLPLHPDSQQAQLCEATLRNSKATAPSDLSVHWDKSCISSAWLKSSNTEGSSH